jgi:hypothetical protein
MALIPAALLQFNAGHDVQETKRLLLLLLMFDGPPLRKQSQCWPAGKTRMWMSAHILQQQVHSKFLPLRPLQKIRCILFTAYSCNSAEAQAQLHACIPTIVPLPPMTNKHKIRKPRHNQQLLLCLKLTLGPFVHHIFVPLRTYLSPFLSARVRMLTASEPALGSLIDSAPMASPAQQMKQQMTNYIKPMFHKLETFVHLSLTNNK